MKFLLNYTLPHERKGNPKCSFYALAFYAVEFDITHKYYAVDITDIMHYALLYVIKHFTTDLLKPRIVH